MKNSRRRSGSPGAPSAPAEPPPPWLGILKTCLYWTLGASLATVLVAAFTAGSAAAFSVGLAALLVIAFFAVGLLVADAVGRVSPGAALGAFILTYLVKVFGIGFILLAIGIPAWVDRGWFLWTAIGVVVLWQAGEIRAFSKARLPLYGSGPGTTSGRAGE
jgi:ATP synthase protein I